MTEATQTYEGHRFCFFINGLDKFDEFNGLEPEDSSNYRDPIDFLLR